MTVEHKSPECVTLCTSRERPIVTEYSVYFYDVENAQVCIHALGHHLGILLQQTSIFSTSPLLKGLLDNNYHSVRSGPVNSILLCLLHVMIPVAS